MKNSTDIRPPEKWFKKWTIKVVFFILGRSFQAASVLDKNVKRDLELWPDGFTVLFKVMTNGPFLLLQKKNSKLRVIGTKEDSADLVVIFKNVDGAFLIMTAQLGFPMGYAEHRLAVEGNLAGSMALIRISDAVQSYLFPKIIARLVLKRVPEMTLRRWGVRLAIYFIAVPFGLIK